MPKCKLRFNVLTASLLLLGSLPAGAQSSVWDGSYAADGACYCSGNLGPEIDSQIMPTPIGGQAVRQICERIGAGPTLLKTNENFNYPVYADAQCGHGPYPNGVSPSAERGPKWDLASVYSSTPEDEAVTPGVSDTPIVTSGPRYIVPNKSATENDTVAETNTTPTPTPKQERVSEPVAVVKAPSVTTPQPKAVVKPEPQTKESLMARLADKMEVARQRARDEKLEKQRLNEELAQQRQAEAQQQTLNAKAKEAEAVATETTVAKVPEAPAEPAKPAQQTADTDSVETKREELEAALNVAKESESANVPILAALKLPNQVRSSSREFNFVQAQPVNFDFGGAGLSVAASASSHNRIQYFLDASLADTYREVRGGIGYYITPAQADRLTFLFNLGVEAGQFEFSGSGLTTNHTDSGAYIGASSRLVVNNKFELQAGVGYSSFFEGDAKAFGAALFHLNKDIDLTGNVKLGDNDSIGFGVRFYY